MKKRILKGTVKASDIFAFIQGHVVYYLYHSMFNFLLPKHIKEQIKARISSMKIECYLNGSCISCGCKTTHLQMSSKTCGAICYPKMLRKSNWEWLKSGRKLYRHGYIWSLKEGLFIKKTTEQDELETEY